MLPRRIVRFLFSFHPGVECGVKFGVFSSQPIHELPKGRTFRGKDHAPKCKEKDSLEDGKKEAYDTDDN